MRIVLAELSGELPIGLIGPIGYVRSGMGKVARMRLLLGSRGNDHTGVVDLHRFHARKMTQRATDIAVAGLRFFGPRVIIGLC